MTAREFLSQAYLLDQRIRSKMQQVKDLRALACDVKAFAGDEPVSHTRDVTGLQNAVVKIIEEEQALNEEIDRFVETKRQIREMIDRVPDMTMRLVLEKRYLLFESWAQIISDLNYSKRWLLDLHSRALEIVDALLSDAA